MYVKPIITSNSQRGQLTFRTLEWLPKVCGTYKRIQYSNRGLFDSKPRALSMTPAEDLTLKQCPRDGLTWFQCYIHLFQVNWPIYGYFQDHLTHPQSTAGKTQIDEYLSFYQDFILRRETPLSCSMLGEWKTHWAVICPFSAQRSVQAPCLGWALMDILRDLNQQGLDGRLAVLWAFWGMLTYKTEHQCWMYCDFSCSEMGNQQC